MRATRALIHLAHLRHNILIIRKLAGSDCKICLPVKANAYGHGAVSIARAAEEYGVDYLAVAAVSEGEKLRAGGVKSPILLLNHVLPEEIPELLAAKLVPVAASAEYIELLSRQADRHDATLPVHLKVDTGMGRIGCPPAEALLLARRIHNDEKLDLVGLCTHFPSADSTEPADREFTRRQNTLLVDLAEQLKSEGINPGCVHAANSGALATLPESFQGMVRPGLALYGYEPVPSEPLGLRPVMEFETRIVFIKKVEAGQSVSYGRTWTAPSDTVIATLPVGYGDGYNRLLSNKGKVLVKGKLYPVVGRVCMDMCMIDLGPDSGVELYDKAVLFGPDPAGWSAVHIAEAIGTIPYEVTCWISFRVPRVIMKPGGTR
jgi:alanine racemase